MLRTITSIGNFITNSLNGITALSSEIGGRMDMWLKISAEKQKTISIMEMQTEIDKAADEYRRFKQQFSVQEQQEIANIISEMKAYKFN